MGARGRLGHYGDLCNNAALRQSLTLAFAVILGRSIGSGGVLGAQQAIVDRWQNTRETQPQEINQFIDELAMLPTDVQERVCMEMPYDVFQALASTDLPSGNLGRFIQIYFEMCDNANYGWSFAEVIAKNMALLFSSPFSCDTDKAEALKGAIRAAERQNRFAAMDTCKSMVASVHDGELAQRIFEIMVNTPFMEDLDPSSCRSSVIRQAIAILKNNTATNPMLRQVSFNNPFPI
jgi:hypothetical protein